MESLTAPAYVALGVRPEDLDLWLGLLARHVEIEHEQPWERGGKSLYFRDPARNSVEAVPPPDMGPTLRLVGTSLVLRAFSYAFVQGDPHVRVLMTGGYGCIGSWIAKQLCEAGEQVWIYDLKEDTHRLDLVLDPKHRAAVHFLQGYVLRLGPCNRRRFHPGQPYSSSRRAANSRVPREPDLRRKVNVIGTLAVFETVLALKDQVHRVVYASSAAVHGPPEPNTTAPSATASDWPPSRTTGLSKVCNNELNARVYWLDHGITSIGLRPWTVC